MTTDSPKTHIPTNVRPFIPAELNPMHYLMGEAKGIFEPSKFTEFDINALISQDILPSDQVICPFCPTLFEKVEDSVLHLQLYHNIHIKNPKNIADLPRYYRILKEIFKIGEYVPYAANDTVVVDPDVFEWDMELRQTINQMKLKQMLQLKEFERSKEYYFKRQCLFCNKNFTQTESYFTHMLHVHQFNVGRPDNLVNIADFCDTMEERVQSCMCLFCDRTFKSPRVLKQHMRKKGHFKLDANNSYWDRFYLVNYANPGMAWQDVDKERSAQNSTPVEQTEESVNDWVAEEGEHDLDCICTCLFCKEMLPSANQAIRHVLTNHGMDLHAIYADLELDYYGMVQMITYIRKNVKVHKCIHCNQSFKNHRSLLIHMEREGHYKLPEDTSVWRVEENLVPIDSEDALLFSFETVEEFEKEEETVEDDIVQRVRSNSLRRVERLQDADDFLDAKSDEHAEKSEE
ncbi:hypothetical protein PCE1_002392 [Barthelona sp. PCE]